MKLKSALIALACLILLLLAISLYNGARQGTNTGTISHGEFLNDCTLVSGCEASIRDGGEKVQVSFTDKGDVYVKRGGVTIFSVLEYDVLKYLDEEHSEAPSLARDVISFQDVTYDGYKDIAVRSNSGAYNFYYDYFAYDPVTKRFKSDYFLQDIANPVIDLQKRTITSFDKGRAFADYFVQDTYTWKGDTYVLTNKVTQEIITDDSVSPLQYKRIVEELQDGKWVVTQEKIFGEEDEEEFPYSIN